MTSPPVAEPLAPRAWWFTGATMRPALPVPVRTRWWSIAHLAGSAAVATGTFLPWLHSGERAMSIYDLRSTAHRLELLSDPWVLQPIAFVPLVVALGLLARWAGRVHAAHVVALAAAGYTAAGALMVRSSGLPPGSGTTVVLLGAAVLVAAAAGELLWARRAGRSAADIHGVGGLMAPSRRFPLYRERTEQHP